jgi:hypothetical protein
MPSRVNKRLLWLSIKVYKRERCCEFGEPGVQQKRRNCMLDLLIVVVTIVTFLAFIGFSEGCERL